MSFSNAHQEETARIHRAPSTAQIEAASEMRRRLSRLFDAGDPGAIVFVPGLAIGGLWPLLGGLGIERLALTSLEYYGSHSFPLVANVTTLQYVDDDEFVRAISAARAQAVVMSVVSCSGTQLPVAKTFAALRRAVSPTPLLIADYSHAGAVGFPRIQGLNADVVCGDPSKWLLPGEIEDWFRLRFLWFTSAVLDVGRPLFSSILFATEGTSEKWLSSGVSPQDIEFFLQLTNEAGLEDRETLQERCIDNCRCAAMIASGLGRSRPETALLTLNEQDLDVLRSRWSDDVMRQIEKCRLLRRDPVTGTIRLFCRADRLRECGLDFA